MCMDDLQKVPGNPVNNGARLCKPRFVNTINLSFGELLDNVMKPFLYKTVSISTAETLMRFFLYKPLKT